MASLSHSTLNAVDLMDALHHSAGALDQALQLDRNYMDLSDMLQVNQHNQPNASGHLDFDYPGLEDPRIGLSSVSEIGNVKKVPLPAELVEQFGRMQCNCTMGLFPEIGRAWLSIDNDIFVWNYEDGSDISYFDGMSETILSAGLIKPKPGIFRPHIQYLLCLATPVDIFLLGVSFTTPNSGNPGTSILGEMHLLPEPLFSIPTDNVHIMSISGTDNGRIFMAGKDGCLYELHYQAEDGWFSRKCRKINHSKGKFSMIMMPLYYFSTTDDAAIAQISVDNSRHILYTRSEKGTIQVFDMGEDGWGMCRVASISQDTTVQNAALVARTVDKSNFKPIIHISAIPREDSINIHLVAVTRTGVRLYFTTSPFGDTTGRPCMLTLVHTRLPPGYSARAQPQRPTNVHAAHYRKGTLLLAASQSEDSDLLWTMASDAFPFKKQLQETHEMCPIDGRTWAMAEVPDNLLGSVPVSLGAGLKSDPPLVVTQHMQPNRKFIIINSQGSYILTKQNPSDQLRQLLLNNGSDSDEVEAYFRLHQEQAFATCLMLACNQSITEQQITELATRAFFRYGGDPKYNLDVSMGQGLSATTLGPNLGSTIGGISNLMGMSSPAPGIPHQASTPFPNVAQHLSFQSNATMMGPGQGSEVIFSSRFRGLCLYLARILRPIWDFRMVNEYSVKTQDGLQQFLSSRCNSEDIGWILSKLQDLKEFVSRNSQFTSALVAEGFAQTLNRSPRSRVGLHRGSETEEQAQRKFQAEAEAQENTYLKQIQQLINLSCEALGLWQILCSHQFHMVTKTITKDQQNILRHQAFRQFVTQGKEMSHALITSLINMYLDDNAATDAISTRLREVCPAFYSFEDQVYSKGNEKLKTATSQQSSQERERLLSDALQKYKQITTQLDLPTVCKQFASVRFYRGIVDLALTSAESRDPQGFALHYYENGEPSEDSQGMYAYRMRMDCYKCITEMLDFLLSTSLSHPHSPSVPSSPGPPPPTDPNRLTNREAEVYVEEVFTMVLKSQDQMFHVCLYDWLVMKQLSEKLLEIQSPYLEPYLKRKTLLQPDVLDTLDLLWKYYEKTRNFSAAAKILAKLADKIGDGYQELGLLQRMEYLSRAIMCAKGSTQSIRVANEGEFLHQLEEKMEVARLQLSVSDALQHIKGEAGVEDALVRLNTQLLDITTLYGEFADRFDLSECKLAIVHCAGHHDPTMVEALWQDIVDKELHSIQNADVQTRMKSLNQKLVSLGRIYATSEKYFPLAFLIKFLERRSCECNIDDEDLSFVFKSIQGTGITLPRLHEIYDRLFKAKDFSWKALKKPFHLLQVIHKLLSLFAESPTVVPAYDRRHFTTTALDAIAFYLVELQSESSSGDVVRLLIGQFRDLQARLERFV